MISIVFLVIYLIFCHHVGKEMPLVLRATKMTVVISKYWIYNLTLSKLYNKQSIGAEPLEKLGEV